MLKPHIDHLVSSALSFYGQHCTAIKLIFVPDDDNEDDGTGYHNQSHCQVHSSILGWQTYSSITPLPNHEHIWYMKELLQDVVEQGATIYTGGDIIGSPDSMLMTLVVVGTIWAGMPLYTEEQFGPIVAVAQYKSMPKEVILLNKWPFLDTMNTFFEPLSMLWGLCTGRLPSIWCQANLWTLSHSRDKRAIVWHWGSFLSAMHSVPTVVAELAAVSYLRKAFELIESFSTSGLSIGRYVWRNSRRMGEQLIAITVSIRRNIYCQATVSAAVGTSCDSLALPVCLSRFIYKNLVHFQFCWYLLCQNIALSILRLVFPFTALSIVVVIIISSAEVEFSHSSAIDLFGCYGMVLLDVSSHAVELGHSTVGAFPRTGEMCMANVRQQHNR
jgi:Aldehyde dehydrogenase family